MTHYLFTIALLPPAVFALFWAVKRKKHTGMAAGFWFDRFLVRAAGGIGISRQRRVVPVPCLCGACVCVFAVVRRLYPAGAFALEYGADAQAGTAEPQAYADADPCSGDPCAYGASVGFGQKRIVSLAVSAVDGASGDGGLFRFAQPGVSDGVLCGKVGPAA